MKTIVSEKCQITIPKVIREKLGLRPGTVLEMEAVHGKLVGAKREQADPIGSLLGKERLPGGLDVDDYLARVRG